ncbi:diguanylate cyclase [Sphingomonas sp. NFR15]|uniref:GGDEF domain-containing protein n=1 Tax=Sphingomonas sp. NFR15 TaxID=1566282 RepID=UPI000890F822|nr:GGDEF domain-containing protein [Sphingomonas sp. NFR15]SDA34817.1 diguanylate cyclase (GGDEF) domain-containing protein [Sphingomonas sp. NFR15]
MDGAVYALIVNACAALLFAVAFAVIRFSYHSQRAVEWFCVSYALVMLAPLSELGVRFSAWSPLFVATSYASLLLSTLATPLGLAAMSGRALPWRGAALILVCGAVLRAAIWGGHRNALPYEMAFQAPFAAASALSAWVAIRTVRERGGRLWTAVAILFAVSTVYFLAKPVFASTFGSGASAREYASSKYALFSQATGGLLLITVGLLILLIAVEQAMGRTILESETDPLTGVANRRGFERAAARMIAHAGRTREPLALAMFDLDHFKRVNDTYGHAAGDAVIRAFADLLLKMAPRSATVARLGGEEFVLLLDRTTLKGAWHVATAIRKALPGIAHLPNITASGGIAQLKPGDTLATLLERADQRAYEAKFSGRDRIVPNPPGVVSAPVRAVPAEGAPKDEPKDAETR